MGSDTYLRIIPASPSFVPDGDRQKEARDFLQDLFPDLDINFSTSPTIEFIDAGSNFEDVFCHQCGAQIEVEDWQDAVSACYETHFEQLSFKTPCCSAEVSLNDLKYSWPVGFSKFSISVMNPQDELDEAALEDLQIILRTALRVIWAHY